MTDLTTTITTVEATVTLTVNGITQTFRAAVQTDGAPDTAARSALDAVKLDAQNWTWRPLREALEATR